MNLVPVTMQGLPLDYRHHAFSSTTNWGFLFAKPWNGCAGIRVLLGPNNRNVKRCFRNNAFTPSCLLFIPNSTAGSNLTFFFASFGKNNVIKNYGIDGVLTYEAVFAELILILSRNGMHPVRFFSRVILVELFKAGDSNFKKLVMVLRLKIHRNIKPISMGWFSSHRLFKHSSIELQGDFNSRLK